MTHYLNGFVLDVECSTCAGTGEIYNSHECMKDCPACSGRGWRPMTADEIEAAAEAAFSDGCEGEPPVSAQERYEAAVRQRQALRS